MWSRAPAGRIIEQIVRALSTSHRGHVREVGRNRFIGPDHELLNDPKGIDLYLSDRFCGVRDRQI